jgi:hypothetical protein
LPDLVGCSGTDGTGLISATQSARFRLLALPITIAEIRLVGGYKLASYPCFQNKACRSRGQSLHFYVAGSATDFLNIQVPHSHAFLGGKAMMLVVYQLDNTEILVPQKFQPKW